jgi:hypothetical protein
MARGDVEPVATWGRSRSSASREVRETEKLLEQEVSSYIGSMPFLWLGVDDDPGPASERGTIERGAISVLSRLSNLQADAPSERWLGNFAARPLIRESGLWNVNHVHEAPSPGFLRLLEKWVARA